VAIKVALMQPAFTVFIYTDCHVVECLYYGSFII